MSWPAMPSSIDPGAIDAAGRHALPEPRPRPRHVSEVRQDGDLIVTVCDFARAPQHAQRVRGRLGDLNPHAV